MNTKQKERLTLIIKRLQETAAKLGVHPSEVSKTQFFKNVDDVSPWDLREVGGLSGVKSAHFPVVSKDLITIREQKETSKYINQLEKQISEKELFEQRVLEQLSRDIKPVKIGVCKPRKSKDVLEREVVVSINDTHYGLIVAPDEVSGANKFGWTEACRRTAFLAQQTLEYKIEKRGQVKRLHVVINGDIISGIIHDLTARTSELLVHQVNGAIHILGHFIAHVAQGYPEVVVHAVAGNHDDAPHRREGGRVTSHKYDSYANFVYFALSAMFRGNDNVKFNMTKGLSLDVLLPAGRLLVTHGDTLFSSSLGNPSSNLQTKRISDAINRYNAGEMARGKDTIKMVLMGHVHSYVDFLTFDGVRVLIAPSLSGVDSYAASLGINCNGVGQMIFESTKNHILGDPRLVELTEADNNVEMDKIIPTFENKLQW